MILESFWEFLTVNLHLQQKCTSKMFNFERNYVQCIVITISITLMLFSLVPYIKNCCAKLMGFMIVGKKNLFVEKEKEKKK